jgi:hypothetical protein
MARPRSAGLLVRGNALDPVAWRDKEPRQLAEALSPALLAGGGPLVRSRREQPPRRHAADVAPVTASSAREGAPSSGTGLVEKCHFIGGCCRQTAVTLVGQC